MARWRELIVRYLSTAITHLTTRRSHGDENIKFLFISTSSGIDRDILLVVNIPGIF